MGLGKLSKGLQTLNDQRQEQAKAEQAKVDPAKVFQLFHDNANSQRIIGTWTAAGATPNGTTVTATQTYLPNGVSTVTGTVTIAEKTYPFNYSVTWQIKDNKLHEVITTSTMIPELSDTPIFPVGKILSDDEIIKLTDTELTTRDKDNDITTMHRVDK